MEFPGRPVVRTWCFHCSGPVQSLVGKLESHKQLGSTKKLKVTHLMEKKINAKQYFKVFKFFTYSSNAKLNYSRFSVQNEKWAQEVVSLADFCNNCNLCSLFPLKLNIAVKWLQKVEATLSSQEIQTSIFYRMLIK